MALSNKQRSIQHSLTRTHTRNTVKSCCGSLREAANGASQESIFFFFIYNNECNSKAEKARYSLLLKKDVNWMREYRKSNPFRIEGRLDTLLLKALKSYKGGHTVRGRLFQRKGWGFFLFLQPFLDTAFLDYCLNTYFANKRCLSLCPIISYILSVTDTYYYLDASTKVL